MQLQAVCGVDLFCIKVLSVSDGCVCVPLAMMVAVGVWTVTPELRTYYGVQLSFVSEL